MPKEAPLTTVPIAETIPIAKRIPISDIRGIRGPALSIKCACALNGNGRVAFSQAVETSGRM